MLTEIGFLIFLVLVNAFFAASEIALISLNDNKIRLMAEEGDKKAKLLMRLLGEPSRFLATIQIGITLAGFLASAFAAESFADPLVGLIGEYYPQIPFGVLKGLTVMVITVVLAYFTLVLGELVPKRIAMQRAEQVAFSVVTPLIWLSVLTNPFVKLLTFSTNFVVRMFGIDPHAGDDNVTEEEIRMMVDVGEEKGTIDERERIMINNIFEFNNKTAEDIMTHRMELTGISADSSLKQLIKVVSSEQYSRIPVYVGSIDNVVGVLHVKDLLPLIASENEEHFTLSNYMRKPYFIPAQKKIDELFLELQGLKNHMAIVLDEYGGTAGIVTIEDLVEEIVGKIFDEYDAEEDKELTQIDDYRYEASGMISLDDLEEVLEADLPVEDYETLNGFLISLFGEIPSPSVVNEVRYKHIVFKVLSVTHKRIEKVLITIDVPVDLGADDK